MIAIAVKWTIKPEYAEDWPQISREYTEATQNEPGCLWFEWSRSLDDPNTYVLIEGFRDSDAGGEHVNTAHFHKGMAEFGQYVASRPKIVSVETPGDGWNELGELKM